MKMIKILLSIVIVSLSALLVPLEGHDENLKTEPVTIQAKVVKSAGNQDFEVMELSEEIAINFEIDVAIEEMNQEIEKIKSIEDKKEWFIAYKSIIDEYSYIIDTPETIYDCFSDEELDLLFRVVQAEVGDEYSFESKVNVASVIFNRLDHERFPDTLSEILVHNQFSPISDGRYKDIEVSKDTILACEYAFSVEDTTDGCLFFDSNNTLNYKFVFNDSAHNFYKYRED